MKKIIKIIYKLSLYISFKEFKMNTSKCSAITKRQTKCTRNSKTNGLCKVHFEQKNNESCCAICTEKTNEKLLPCNHVVHMECQIKWGFNCPLCRKQIDNIPYTNMKTTLNNQYNNIKKLPEIKYLEFEKMEKNDIICLFNFNTELYYLMTEHYGIRDKFFIMYIINTGIYLIKTKYINDIRFKQVVINKIQDALNNQDYKLYHEQLIDNLNNIL